MELVLTKVFHFGLPIRVPSGTRFSLSDSLAAELIKRSIARPVTEEELKKEAKAKKAASEKAN